MASMTRDSLLDSIKALLASAEQLPEDIFADRQRRNSIQQQLTRLRDDVTTPSERLMGEICFQPHQSTAVKIALEAKWFEALADGQPRTAEEIAACTDTDPKLIVRIMMVLTATNIVNEKGPRTYSATPLSQLLLDPAWANGLRHFHDHCGPSLINLPTYLKRNSFRDPQDVKTGPFADAWGGKNTWALYEAEPWRGKIFNSFMTRWKDGIVAWHEIYPAKTKLSDQIEKTEGAVLLVDVGGGSGHVTKDFARVSGHRTGRLIVQDLPAAVGDAESLEKQGIEAMAYDFFTTQPVKGAKAYYLQGILHDWPDHSCREILSNTAAAMRKGYSKLLINEMVLPDTGVNRKGAFLDLSMMALETGAERTSQQWDELLASAGLRIEKIWSTGSGPESVIEAEIAN